MRIENIPAALRERPQWVLWKNVVRNDEPTKVPFQTSGVEAKANDPATWTTFEACAALAENYEGVGYEFSSEDPFCGVDLDGCRDPETGIVAPWAKEIILALGSYAEVSPSKTGVKIFCLAKSPFPSGRKQSVNATKVCEKQPAIEIYDQKRYFAVTGWRLNNMHELRECQAELNQVCARMFPKRHVASSVAGWQSEAEVIERARKYIALIPGAVSGQGGHNTTFNVACALVLGFGLSKGDAYKLLHEYNARCEPQWSERELQHKIEDADAKPDERNYLRNKEPESWDKIWRKYECPSHRFDQRESVPTPSSIRVTTLKAAALAYVDKVETGKDNLIELGLGEVDTAIGGGVEQGEMVVMAACPSHGKSAVALQVVHTWNGNNRPSIIISEEMSALALGKRTLQYASEVPQEHWFHRGNEIRGDVERHFGKRANCVVVEGCKRTDTAIEQIRKAHKEHNIQGAVVDYAQLLIGQGKSKYDQVSYTSVALRQIASELKIVLLVLAQLNREVHKRKGAFLPKMSDLRDSGQIEQDADVIMLLVWPYRLDPRQPANEYKFGIAKNRNREIYKHGINARFIPSRQMILPEALKKNMYLDQFSSAASQREDGF